MAAAAQRLGRQSPMPSAPWARAWPMPGTSTRHFAAWCSARSTPCSICASPCLPAEGGPLISLACQPRSSGEAVPRAPLATVRRTACCHPPGGTGSRPRASAHPRPAINRTATTSRRDREHGRAAECLARSPRLSRRRVGRARPPAVRVTADLMRGGMRAQRPARWLRSGGRAL